MPDPLIHAEGFFDQDPTHTGTITLWPDRVVFTRTNTKPLLDQRITPQGDRQVVFLRGLTTVSIYTGRLATQVVFTAGGLGREGAWLTADAELGAAVYLAIVEAVAALG